ncbi:hypothetical protein PG984_005471 [Apiospora sp. TS-2023a]
MSHRISNSQHPPRKSSSWSRFCRWKGSWGTLRARVSLLGSRSIILSMSSGEVPLGGEYGPRLPDFFSRRHVRRLHLDGEKLVVRDAPEDQAVAELVSSPAPAPQVSRPGIGPELAVQDAVELLVPVPHDSRLPTRSGTVENHFLTEVVSQRVLAQYIPADIGGMTWAFPDDPPLQKVHPRVGAYPEHSLHVAINEEGLHNLQSQEGLAIGETEVRAVPDIGVEEGGHASLFVSQRTAALGTAHMGAERHRKIFFPGHVACVHRALRVVAAQVRGNLEGICVGNHNLVVSGGLVVLCILPSLACG